MGISKETVHTDLENTDLHCFQPKCQNTESAEVSKNGVARAAIVIICIASAAREDNIGVFRV